MKKKVELPLVEPVYRTYHSEAAGSAILKENPTIRNWYLNNVVILTCNRRFLSGCTTPEVLLANGSWGDNPCLEKICYPVRFLNGYLHSLIRNLIDAGYYVYFLGVDDYYVPGKSWYRERHFNHDGIICGYDQENDTYCIYAYDSDWRFQKFWTPRKGFDAGLKAMLKQEYYGMIAAIKAKNGNVEFLPDVALAKIEEYLDSSLEKYPENQEGRVSGIVVHDYLAKYLDKLYDGSIPYERMDRRPFRVIWEHKKVMLERIQCIERALGLSHDISEGYRPLVSEADAVRMLYASYHRKQRNSLLPVIRQKLLALKEKEALLLNELLGETGYSNKEKQGEREL